jgi:TonB-dependent receptor
MTLPIVGSSSKSLRFAFLTTTCVAALLAQPVFAQTDQTTDADAEDDLIMEEVHVTGIRRSLDFAADVKRSSDQIVDALMAQDIGLFSDNNIGEALSRIPGVLLEREAGEGYRISIRGLGPRFVRTTVNGRTALSPSGGETGGGDDARGFTYNIMPSEVVHKVKVLKSVEARNIEGGIGGTVDLETNRPLDFANDTEQKLYLSGTARGTYNDLSEDWNPRVTGFANYKFNDNFAGYIGGVYDDADRIDNLLESQRLRTYDHDLKAGTYLNGELLEENLSNQDYAIFSGVRYQDQPIERERETYIMGLQWKTDSWDVNFDWTYGTEDETRDDKRYWMNTSDLSRRYESDITSLWVDFDDAMPDQAVPTDGTIYRFEWDGAMRNNQAAGLYRQIPRESDVHVGGINAEWNNDTWVISGDIGYASQETERVLERLRSRLNTKLDRFDDGTTGYFDISSGYSIVEMWDTMGGFIDPTDTSHQLMDLLERTITTEEADDISARLDFSMSLGDRNEGDLWSLFDSMDFGVAWNEMQFTRELLEKEADPDDFTIEGKEKVLIKKHMPDIKVPGFVHEFAVININDPAYRAYLDGDDPYWLNQNGTFDVTEETMAGYLQFSMSGGERFPFRGNVGVRYVDTDQTNRGWVGQDEGEDFIPADPDNPIQTTKRNYSEWLPALNIAWDLTDDWVIRAAANRTMTRPDPIDLSSQINISDLDDEDDLTGSGGNPNLDPYMTDNYDLSLEWYPEFGGNYGLGFFYKDLKGFISRGTSPELVTIDGVEYIYDIRRPVNTDGGEITGIEFQFHTPFDDFFDNWLQYFGMNGSFTYVDAEMDAVVPDRNVPISLRGTSEKSGNFVLYFEKQKFGARVAINYRDDYLYQEASDDDRFDEWTEGRTIVDLNLDYAIRKNMKLRFTANNLTDEHRARFWYTPNNWFSDERHNGRTYVVEFRMTTD